MSLVYQAGCFLAMTAFYLGGGFGLARYATDQNAMALMLSIAAYFAGNAFLLSLLQSNSYSIMMTLSTIGVMVGHVVLAHLFMDEKYTAIQTIGVGLAVLSILLVSLPELVGGKA